MKDIVTMGNNSSGTKEIIIIGNSGSATEVYEIVYTNLIQFTVYRLDYQFKGFLGYNRHEGILEGIFKQYDLGFDDEYTIQENDVFVIGIGDNKTRMEAYEKFKSNGAKFINVISPWAGISHEVEMGEGNIINIGCYISPQCKIGNCNYLNGEVRIGHNAQVGDFNFFGIRALVMGNAKIGSSNKLGPTALLMEKSKIGDNNTIAPGAIVYKGCKNNCLMAGNPALIIEKQE